MNDYVDLVRDGQYRFSLYRMPTQNAEAYIEAADELMHYCHKSIGRSMPQVDESQPVRLVMFLDYRSGLEREEFVIEAAGDKVELRARTVQGMFHAVYYFLEKALGVRWLWPGTTGEVVPKHADIRWPIGTVREKPDYAWRAFQSGGAFYGPKNGLDYNTTMHAVLDVPLSHLKEVDLWHRRNRLGGLKAADGHRLSEIIPPETYGVPHPEYFAMLNGERDCKPHDGKHLNQPCLSNPAVLDLIAGYAIKRFEVEPDLDILSVSLNDGGGSCECDACRKIDEMAQARDIKTIEHFDQITREGGGDQKAKPSTTDRLFWAMRQVGARVAERFPDKLLLTHLYSDYRRPAATFNLPDNFIGQYCVMANSFWNRQDHDVELPRIRAFGGAIKQLGIYEYYSFGASQEVHRLYPELIAESLKEYYEAGVRYLATQPGTAFAINGLNFYLLGRYLWDVEAPLHSLMDDFFEKGFGSAASHVRRFFDAFAERYKETQSATALPQAPEPRLRTAYLYPPEFLQARHADLSNARAAAANHPEVLARIEFLQKGLDFTSLYLTSLRETLATYKAAGTDNRNEMKSTSEVCRAARKAIQAWDKFWSFVRGHMNQFIFGEYWVHYHPGLYGRSDKTLAKLRELAG